METRICAPNYDGVDVVTRLNNRDLATIVNNEIWRELINQTAEKFATYIYENHFPEIMAQINTQAVANMSIAQAGAAINETLQKKIPDKILEIHHNYPTNVKGMGDMTR